MIDEKRWFLCPFEKCDKKFCSQRMADTCINFHLGLLYKCKTCDFVTHNYDSSREITNVLPMQGVESESQRQHQQRGRGRGKKVKKSRDGEEKEGKDVEGGNVKKEEEEEIIVIN